MMNPIKGFSQTLPKVLLVRVTVTVMGDTLQGDTLHHLGHIHPSLTVILRPDIPLKATLPKVATLLKVATLPLGTLPKVDTLHLGTLPMADILLQVLIMVHITQEVQILEACWLAELLLQPQLMGYTT
uniref:Uncharacterized protein n=1 Tax=Opuntia streptacantha TaxID=393608 RepID=A0A7C9DHG4_OPUST